MNIKECHVILDQSQRRISYVHLCKNTKYQYSIIPTYQFTVHAHEFSSRRHFVDGLIESVQPRINLVRIQPRNKEFDQSIGCT